MIKAQIYPLTSVFTERCTKGIVNIARDWRTETLAIRPTFYVSLYSIGSAPFDGHYGLSARGAGMISVGYSNHDNDYFKDILFSWNYILITAVPTLRSQYLLNHTPTFKMFEVFMGGRGKCSNCGVLVCDTVQSCRKIMEETSGKVVRSWIEGGWVTYCKFRPCYKR
jgi:hypothetical protein